MSKTYDQDKIDALALHDQQAGHVSEELWEAVKRVACKVCRDRGVEEDDITGVAAEAVCEALKVWDSERGRFSMTVHFSAMKYAQEHYHRMGECVRKPMHIRGEEHKKICSINPDGATHKGEDASDTFWDSLGSVSESETPYDITILEEVLAGLPESQIELYTDLYENELSRKQIAIKHGVTRETVRIRVNALHEIIRKRYNRLVDLES